MDDFAGEGFRSVSILRETVLSVEAPFTLYGAEISNAVLFLRLGLPATFICYAGGYGAFKKLSANQLNLKTPT